MKRYTSPSHRVAARVPLYADDRVVGASADSTDSGGSNGLHYAARGSNLDGVKLAVTLGLSISSANNGAVHPSSARY